MSGVLIVNPMAVAAVPAVAGSGAANLLTYDPNEAWIATSAASATIDVDMGVAVSADSFFIGHTNADQAATWTIETGATLGSGLAIVKAAGPMRAADSDGPRHHAFARLVAPVVSRFFRFTLNQAGASPLFAGTLIIGRAFEKHREYGPGRTIIDTGAREDLPGGGFGIGDGTVKAQFAWSFIDLTDVELQRLWSIKKDRGLRKPLLVVEDADLTVGLNDAIHYGVLERGQAYERADADISRWAGSIVEWA